MRYDGAPSFRLTFLFSVDTELSPRIAEQERKHLIAVESHLPQLARGLQRRLVEAELLFLHSASYLPLPRQIPKFSPILTQPFLIKFSIAVGTFRGSCNFVHRITMRGESTIPTRSILVFRLIINSTFKLLGAKKKAMSLSRNASPGSGGTMNLAPFSFKMGNSSVQVAAAEAEVMQPSAPPGKLEDWRGGFRGLDQLDGQGILLGKKTTLTFCREFTTTSEFFL